MQQYFFLLVYTHEPLHSVYMYSTALSCKYPISQSHGSYSIHGQVNVLKFKLSLRIGETGDFIWFTEYGRKKRKYPVSCSRLGENALSEENSWSAMS